MEKQKLIYVESKAQFSPSEVSDKAIVFIEDTKEIWTHGVYFSCSGAWATPITLSLTGDTTGSVSIDGSGNASITTTTNYLSGAGNSLTDYNNAATTQPGRVTYYPMLLNNATNKFPTTNNANGILSLNVHDYSYTHQLGFSSDGNIYHRRRNGGTWETSWKTILSSTNYTNFPHTFASLTNKPTTLSGYGITDCIPIIKGGLVTTDTDLSTLGMTTSGVKFSISHTNNTNVPSWGYGYGNFLMFRSTSDTYGGIFIDTFSGYVNFIGGRNLETTANNVPNWWFRIYGTNGQTYNLATIQTAINNLGSTYLPLTGGTLTDTLILKAGAFTASNSNSYSGGRYQAVAKPNIRLIGDSTYGLSTIEFISQKGDTSINKPSDSGFIQFQPYGVSALSSVGSHPTLKTSGETNALVLGVTNDADDIIVLQSPNVSGLRHACGTTEYYLPHVTTSTTTANKPLVSTTTAHVYTLGAECLPLSGGTMTGALNFANNTWNKVGDDAYMGDCNVAGMIGIKGSNATPGFAMYNDGGTLLGKLYASGSDLYWSDAKILTASGTSKQFVMGDGSLYSNTVSYTTWTKTTTSGIAWFPIADITDSDQGTALFMVRGYAHSSIIFTVTKGYDNGNINVLAGGGSFNGSYAYIKGVRQVGTAVELGLNAAATYVSVVIRVLQPTFTYSLRPSLVESTSTTTPSVQYELNTNGGNHNFGIVSSKFTGNLIGNADTASNISTVNPILAQPFEKNTIQVVSNPQGALAEQQGTAAAITHALRFNWYNTAYEIGNVRGGATNSLGFGITYGNNNLCLLVKTNGTYSPYGFIGSLSGNASTASKWATARTITLTGDVTGSVTLDGSSNVTLTTSTSGTGTTSFLKCPDKRNSYPAEIVTSGGNIGAAFMSTSTLGISEGYYCDTLILRGYATHTAGYENALFFNKQNSSVYHSQYAFGSTTTWGTMYKFLDSNNYSSYALPLSGGTMTGVITLTSGVGVANDKTALSFIKSSDKSEQARIGTDVTNGLGMYAKGNIYIRPNVTLGSASTNGLVISSSSFTYNGNAVLTSSNYTDYTIPYSKVNVTNGALGAFIYNGNLQHNNNFKYLTFFPSDNLGNVSYVLIAKIDNWANTANATSSISYGINGLFIAYRGGNMANTGSYFVTNVAYVNTNYKNYKLYLSEFKNPILVPQLVIYQDEYYLAFKKDGSSTDYHFYGQVFNILPSFIYIDDTSLITLVSGPFLTATTGLYYYNNGNGLKKFLHEGNYSNYALPLSGGTLTGILKSTQTAGSLGTSPIVCTGNVASTAGINNTYSHLASNLATGGALQIFIGKSESSYNGGSIGYWHKGGDGSSGNALTFGLCYADNLMVMQGNGNVGINNTSPSYKLDVGGDIYSSGYVRAKSGFIKTDSSDSYVLLGGGGHKLLSDLSATHNHSWSDITSVPRLLGSLSTPIFYPYANDAKLGAYISTINNRFYSADLRYTVTTTNFMSGNVHYLFDDNYDSRVQINKGTTATITIEGYNFVYNNGYIILYFYLYSAYPLLFPKSITAVATRQDGTTYTLNRATSIESGNTIAFSIGLEYLTKIEFTIVSQDNAYCGITNIDYYSRRTEDTVRDCAVVTKYNANTLYHNLTAPKYIVSGGTSSQFLKADGSLDSTSYLPTAGGTLGDTSATQTELRLKSSTTTLRLLAYSDTFNYIQSGNADFNGSTPLQITGYNGTVGSDLYLKFTNIYCRSGNYANIDSGNYSSYALPLSGGTLTGTLISRDIRPSANVSYSLGTSSYYYNYVYAKYFKKNGSSDSYVLLGGGGHKAVSDFTMKEQKTTTSISGNTDQWSIILEQSYPADHWYDIVNTFLVEGAQFGSGFLSFYAYWQASSSALKDYITEVYFNGTMRGETTAAFGGSNRDINDYLRIYIDKTNYKLLVYANHYNGKTVRIKRINYNEIDTAGFPNGGILVEHFNDKGTIVSLPTESSTMTRVLIKTHYNHDRTIKTSKSIYASSFYENSDIRLKENIRGIDQSDLTKQVDLVQFNFKDSDTKKYGVIAQQLEQVGLQNLVYENDGKKAVDYISLLVLEIQRLRNEIGELKQEINKKS